LRTAAVQQPPHFLAVVCGMKKQSKARLDNSQTCRQVAAYDGESRYLLYSLSGVRKMFVVVKTKLFQEDSCFSFVSLKKNSRKSSHFLIGLTGTNITNCSRCSRSNHWENWLYFSKGYIGLLIPEEASLEWALGVPAVKRAWQELRKMIRRIKKRTGLKKLPKKAWSTLWPILALVSKKLMPNPLA